MVLYAGAGAIPCGWMLSILKFWPEGSKREGHDENCGGNRFPDASAGPRAQCFLPSPNWRPHSSSNLIFILSK